MNKNVKHFLFKAEMKNGEDVLILAVNWREAISKLHKKFKKKRLCSLEKMRVIEEDIYT